jgi:hypothetical protein
MTERQTCVDCRDLSPETDTNYTLISSRFGWRLTRTTDAAGKLVVEWRCAACWQLYKAARGEPVPDSTRFGPSVTQRAPSETRSAGPPATLDDNPALPRRRIPLQKAKSIPPKGARGR